MKKYIRFGRIPFNEKSKAYKSDISYKEENGVSVWDSIIVNNVYFPLLPNNPSESCAADYFYFLFSSKRVFLVTGDELPQKGSAGEPLLKNVKIIKEMTDDYNYLKTIMKEIKRSN